MTAGTKATEAIQPLQVETPPEMTVAELRAHLETVTDAAAVERLLAAEQAREGPRKTALAILEARLAELTEPTAAASGSDPAAGSGAAADVGAPTDMTADEAAEEANAGDTDGRPEN